MSKEIEAGVNIFPWSRNALGIPHIIVQQKIDMPEELRHLEGHVCGFGGGLEDDEVDRADKILMTEFFQALLRELREEFNDEIARFFALQEGAMSYIRRGIPKAGTDLIIDQVSYGIELPWSTFEKLAQDMIESCREGRVLVITWNRLPDYNWYRGQKEILEELLGASRPD